MAAGGDGLAVDGTGGDGGQAGEEQDGGGEESDPGRGEKAGPGMWLRLSTGKYVQVARSRAWKAADQRVHNLCVERLHTYYVEAGTSSVLVHKCGRGDHDNPVDILHVIDRIESRVLSLHGHGTGSDGSKFSEALSSVEGSWKCSGRFLEAIASAQRGNHCHWCELDRRENIGTVEPTGGGPAMGTRRVQVWLFADGQLSTIHPTLKDSCD
jgi:hypothetical protein